jgi:hypothetical protein
LPAPLPVSHFFFLSPRLGILPCACLAAHQLSLLLVVSSRCSELRMSRCISAISSTPYVSK